MSQPTVPLADQLTDNLGTIIIDLTFVADHLAPEDVWELSKLQPVLRLVTALANGFYRRAPQRYASVDQSHPTLPEARPRTHDPYSQGTYFGIVGSLRGARIGLNPTPQVTIEQMSLGSPWRLRAKAENANAAEQGALAVATVLSEATTGKLQDRLRRGGQAWGEARALRATVAGTQREIERDALEAFADRSGALDRAIESLRAPLQRLVDTGVLSAGQAQSVYRTQVAELLQQAAPDVSHAIRAASSAAEAAEPSVLVEASVTREGDDRDLLHQARTDYDAVGELIEFEPGEQHP